MPRIQVLPLPGDRFALILDRVEDAIDLVEPTGKARLAAFAQECGAESILLTAREVEIG